MNNNSYTLKLLNFQYINISIIKIEFINNTYFIELHQDKDEKICCPKCGGLSTTKNSTNIRNVKYFPINGYPTIILYKQIRFKCKYCNKTFNQPNEIVDYKKSISNDLKNRILQESTYKQSFKDVVRRTNVSQTTVSNEFKKAAITYRSWIKGITNSFIIDPVTHKRLFNGFIEGKNNFCKTIKRIGFGYFDFDVFRYKILNSNKKKKKK